MAATNGDDANAAAAQDDIAKRVPPDTVLPPRTVRDTIEKVAVYVARNGKAFEDRLKADGYTAKTAYLNPDDEYHAYYQWRVAENKAGRGVEANQSITQKTDVSYQGKEVYVPPKPDDFKFSARMPTISAQDLEIVKLTALFAAKNGKSWTTGLSQKEAGNYQFDFLRPSHSLHMYFQAMTEQYQALLEGETVDNGKPQQERMNELEENVNNRSHVLDSAKKRAEYTKYLEKQKVDKEEKAEADRIAFAQIDWHDFIIVGTVVFDERDETADIGPPRTLNDMMSMSLEQKAKMTIDPNRRLEEAFPNLDEFEDIYGNPIQYPAAQVVTPQPPAAGTPVQASPYPPPTETPSLQEERERARAAAKQANQQQARVRTDYVPQAQRRNQLQNTSMCPNCKQQIPNDQFEQHLRIEMLSPEWREQMAKNQQRSSTTNLSTADVANNLKRLASQRADLFDSVTGNPISEEEQARRKRAEMQAYDGVSQVPNAAALGAMGQQPGQYPPGTQPPSVEDQIRYLHDKYKK